MACGHAGAKDYHSFLGAERLGGAGASTIQVASFLDTQERGTDYLGMHPLG